MNLRAEEKRGATVCYLEGELDINSAPSVKKFFEKLIQKKAAKVVVNFKGVSYIDSSGLATLVEILKNMRSYGGKLKLANLSAKIRSLFEITKLEKLFDISAEEEEALAS